MFKRYVILVIAILFCGLTFAQEGDTIPNTESADTLGIHPWDWEENSLHPIAPELAHWSIWLEAGFNIFDGDFNGGTDLKHSVYVPSGGIGAMYSWDCTWGIGAEYKFRNYHVFGTGDFPDKLLKGMMHQANAFITFDIFNVWRPQNKSKIFGLDLILGGGSMWYENSLQYGGTDKNGSSKTKPVEGEETSMDKYKGYGVFVGGASFEFNVSRSIELGLRCVYNYFTKDVIDGRAYGNNNDGIFDCDLILRWKLEAKNKSHVRNFCSDKALDNWIATQSPAPDEHSVDTLYIYTYDTVRIVCEPAQPIFSDNNCYCVYFENDKSDLDEEALTIIQQVGTRLNRDSNLCVNLVGFCDNTGSDARNNELGEERAGMVGEELTRSYNIDPSRIVYIGRGRVQDNRGVGSFRPNRRTEIYLITEEQRDYLLNQYTTEKQEKYNRIPQEGLTISALSANSTLIHMAREYYGNTNCWVYIYRNNISKLRSPDGLQKGMDITLPYLTEEERKITANEAQRLYIQAENSRHK